MTGYKALAIACFMGYDTIYICGLDNDFLKSISVDENNEVYEEFKEFFNIGIKYNATRTHYGKSIPNILWFHYMLFKSLGVFKEYNIINLNKNCLIDTFTKKHNINIYKGE